MAYIQLDTPRSLWSARIAALRQSGFPTDQVFFADRETLGCWPFDIRSKAHREVLSQSLEEIAPDVVVLDTLREACTGADENDSTQMQEVVAYLTAATQPAAIVIVAHGKKPPTEGSHSVVSGNRGSSYVTGKMDAIAHFTSDSLTVIGRAVEETSVSIEKVEIPGAFYWGLDRRTANRRLAADVLADPTLVTIRAKARVLAEGARMDESAAFSMLQRMSKTRPDSVFSTSAKNESARSD